MQDLRKEGLTKSIGVSNFREEDIEEISKSWEIPPAVNQVRRSALIKPKNDVLIASDRVSAVPCSCTQHEAPLEHL